MLIDAHTHLPSVGWPGHSAPFTSVADAVLYLRNAGTDFTGYEPRAFQIRLESSVPDPVEREKVRWWN